MRTSSRGFAVVGLAFLTLAQAPTVWPTTETMQMFGAKRALVELCDRTTKEELNANQPLVRELLSAFEDHLAVCRGAGRRVDLETVDSFRKAAQRYRDAHLHQRDLLVRWYDLILEARPDYRDALEVEYDAAHQFDIDCLHWTDEKASPTEAIRRFEAICKKYPLTMQVYGAHLRIGILARDTNRIDLAKQHLEKMIAVEFADLRGPRPMSREAWKKRFAGGAPVPDKVLDRMDTLERMQDQFEGGRQTARRLLVFQCTQKQSKTLEEMQVEFDRLRGKFPGDERLEALMQRALEEGPKARPKRN